MPVWFIFVLISVFAVAVAEISQKVSLTQKVNISAITNNFFCWTLMGIAGLIISTMTGNFILLTGPQDLIKLLVLGVVYFLGGTFFYTSYKGNSPSISQILGSISVIVSTTVGIIFFNEGLHFLKFAGISLILTAIVILNVTKKERLNKYNFFALFGGVCYGFAYSIDKSFSLELHPFNYLTYMGFSVALVSILIKPLTIVNDTRRMALKDFRPILSSFTFFTIFDVCNFYAYKNGASVGVVDAMNSIAIFLVILAEILFLKDRTHLIKKVFCAGLALSGVVLFSFLK